MELTPDNRRKLEALLQRYPVKRSVLLPLLHQTQRGQQRRALDRVAPQQRLERRLVLRVELHARFFYQSSAPTFQA